MKDPKHLFPILLALVLSLAVSLPALAGSLKEYSADQFLIQKGKEQKTGKIFVSKDKFRMEHSVPGQMEKMFIILRQDKKLTWTVFPDKKKYIESSLTEEDLKTPMHFGAMGDMNVKTTEEDLGTETVNGFECRKKRIHSTMTMMGREMKSSSTVWMCEELGFPIRTENEDGTVTELRNIQIGAQPDSLFELPSGFAKSRDIMEVMGAGMQEDEGPEELEPPAGHEQMPEEMRKMMEEQMRKQN
jgi:hypothetical protein